MNKQTKDIESGSEILKWEENIFRKFCEITAQYKTQYPEFEAGYLLCLERFLNGHVITHIPNMLPVPRYSSSVTIYLARNHFILERGQNEGLFPAVGVDIVTTKSGFMKRKIAFIGNYAESANVQLEALTKDYLENRAIYCENVDDTVGLTKNISMIKEIV